MAAHCGKKEVADDDVDASATDDDVRQITHIMDMKRAKRHKVGGFNLTFVRIHDDRSVIMKTHVAFLLFPRQYVIIDPIVDPMSNHIMPACYTNLLLIAVVR